MVEMALLDDKMRFTLRYASACIAIVFAASLMRPAKTSVITSLQSADFSAYDEQAASAGAAIGAREGSVADVIAEAEEGDSFIALFAFAGCPYCNAAMPAIAEALEGPDADVVYVDTRSNPEWKSNLDIDGYDDLVDLVGDRLPLDDDGREHLYVPHLFFFKAGDLVADVPGLGDDDVKPSEFTPGSEEYDVYVEMVRKAASMI